MTSKKDAVLFALAGVARAHGKGYCYPSQAHIVRLTEKWHKVYMCRRTLNRVLKELEGEGWFERIRRHRRGQGGKIVFGSTLYKLGAKLYRWLGSLKSWLGGFFSHFRVPKVSQYKSQRENEISYQPPPLVNNLWKSNLKVRASPV
jgi:hypothetical protein